MDEDEELSPGLDDPISIPRTQRIARYEAHLREWIDRDLAIHIAATNAIFLKDMEDALGSLEECIGPIESVRKSIEEAFDVGRKGLEIGRVSAEKLMVVLKEKNDRKRTLSNRLLKYSPLSLPN